MSRLIVLLYTPVLVSDLLLNILLVELKLSLNLLPGLGGILNTLLLAVELDDTPLDKLLLELLRVLPKLFSFSGSLKKLFLNCLIPLNPPGGALIGIPLPTGIGAFMSLYLSSLNDFVLRGPLQL